MADKFVVKQGSQVIFSSDDEGTCQLMANKAIQDSIVKGVDVRNSEHAVTVTHVD